jgi:hypothetical protein
VDADDIRFSSIKEGRDWYFVEYFPPNVKERFSTLQLSVVEPHELQAVAEAVEAEARIWLGLYKVPLMATAFSSEGSVLSLEDVRPISHLLAWLDPRDSQPILRWELVKNEVLPDVALDREFLKETFAGIPYRTGREIKTEYAKSLAKQKLGWWLVFAWAVVVPLIVAVVEWWSDLLGLVVLGYAFIKAAVHALRLTGHLPKTATQRDKEAEELKMRHHHYHCQRNPDAFERLKVENFRREEIERTKAEAVALRAKKI